MVALLAGQEATKPAVCKNKPSVLFVLFIVCLTVFIGLRDKVGADWVAYLGYIARMDNQDLSEVLQQQDYLYELANWAGANLFGGIYFVNFVAAMIFCYALMRFCTAQARPWLALVVALPYLVIVVAMGYTRQSVSIAFEMLAILALFKGHFKRCLLWIFLGAMFHRSAIVLVFLPFFFLKNVKTTTAFFFCVVASAATLMAHDWIGSFIDAYIHTEYASEGAGPRILLLLVPALLLLLFKDKFETGGEFISFWIWVAWVTLMLSLMMIITTSSTAVDRLALYLMPLQLFVWARFPDAFARSAFGRFFLSGAIITLSGVIMLTWFLASDYSTYWVPYQIFLLKSV